MSLNTCILIKTTPTQTDAVLQKTQAMTEVRKAFVAYGRYDLVVFARSPDYSAIRKLTSEINSLEGVRSTETLVEA
jgi:DNA-binding Lrp family transcriptional regulator